MPPTTASALLAVALLPLLVRCGDQFPDLLELSETNFTTTLTQLSSSYDWVLMEFYAHW